MRHPRRRDPNPKPDLEGARATLARIRAQREEVEALVDALARERHLNNFTANVTYALRRRK